jgi:hypothetical protein
VGAGQGAFVEKRLHKSGHYEAIEKVSDHAGIVRAIAGKKTSQSTNESTSESQ